MQRAMTPVIGIYWNRGLKGAVARLTLDPNDERWQVTNPNTRRKIEEAAFAFCDETNATTTDQLDRALDRLRAELAAGVVDAGEATQALTERVNAVFDMAETWRAKRIAVTEASRAVHAAAYDTAVESGIVQGYEWLISANACPYCQQVAAEARRVPLGQDFAVLGSNPTYRNVKHPPLHPHCRCTALEILKPEYGGPESVEWNATLDQPSPGPEYEPPRGVTLPEPAPDRINW